MRSTSRFFLWLWLASLFVKIILNTLIPLAPDEAYYWVWSIFPHLSYFDHPGMVAWLFWLGQGFSFLPQGERIPGILLNHLGVLIWLKILIDLWSDDLTEKWIVLFFASPFLGLGSILLTPDSPLLFFWVLSLFALMRLLARDHWVYAVLLGVALGLGFCSKYHIVLFVPSLLVYLTVEKKWQSVRKSNVALVIVFGFLASLPVLIWNSQNQWASFAFQIRHGLGQDSWQPHWTSDYFLGQLFIFFPLTFYYFFRGYHLKQLRLFFWFALVPWVTFFFTSFRGAVQANWPIISYAPALIVAVGAHKKWLQFKFVAGLWILINFLLLIVWIFPVSDKLPRKLTEVHQLREALWDATSHQPLYGGSYQIASILWYYSGQPVYKLRDMSRTDFFDLLPYSVPSEASFFVLREKSQNLPDWLAARGPRTETVKNYGRYELIKVSP